MAITDKIKSQVLAILAAEGIDTSDKAKCIESLSECVAPNACVAAYLSIVNGKEMEDNSCTS